MKLTINLTNDTSGSLSDDIEAIRRDLFIDKLMNPILVVNVKEINL